jgi:hypothetical protein
MSLNAICIRRNSTEELLVNWRVQSREKEQISEDFIIHYNAIKKLESKTGLETHNQNSLHRFTSVLKAGSHIATLALSVPPHSDSELFPINSRLNFTIDRKLLRCLNGNIWSSKSNKPIHYFSDQKSSSYTNGRYCIIASSSTLK